MIRKRAILRMAIAAVIVGIAASFTPPVASADNLPNGLTVTCNPVGDSQLTCVIGGCPRVNGDYVVDIVHVMDNGYQFDDMDFKCINGQTATHNAATNFPPYHRSAVWLPRSSVNNDIKAKGASAVRPAPGPY